MNQLTARQWTRILESSYDRFGPSFLEVLSEKQGPGGIRAYVKSGTLPNAGVNKEIGYVRLSDSTVVRFAILARRRGPGPPVYSQTYTGRLVAALIESL